MDRTKHEFSHFHNLTSNFT